MLQEEPGEYQARYQAIIDLEDNKLPRWSYTAKVLGLPEVKVGRLVPCIFQNSYYNDIKTIKSITCAYNATGRKVEATLGLGDVEAKIVAKQTMKQLRKLLLPAADYAGGAAYEDAVDLDEEIEEPPI